MIWENGIEICIISYMKRVASPGSMHDTGCLGGAWFQCRYGGFWMISYQLMFPEVRSSLVFSGLGLKPHASGFQSHSYNSLKTSPSIQH